MEKAAVNNEFYEYLGERWYAAEDDPVGLLRAESRTRNPWVRQRIREELGESPSRVLDVACGAGFLSNALAADGHETYGIDLSPGSLGVARARDATGAVDYRVMDAHALAFPDGYFDVVCAMDFLEHTADPGAAIREAARVLRPGGLFFFHTFNRNFLSWLIAIKGVEWFVKNTPDHMHVIHLFLKPREVRRFCAEHGLTVEETRGLRPRVWTKAFWSLLQTGKVSADFEFVPTASHAIGYSGWARRTG